MRRRRPPSAVPAAALLAAVLVAVAPPPPVALAQSPPEQAPPTQAPPSAAAAAATPVFALEALRVDGLRRARPRVVLAASQLEAGGRYDEAELARAVARVQRLPFVLDARFRLERGSERGLYLLVIDVVETRRFFFGTEVAAREYGRPLTLEGSFGSDGDVQRTTLAGIRQRVGSAGELTASVATEEGFQLAYTHYDLFGRGAVGGVAVSDSGFCCTSTVLPLGLLPELASFSLREEERARAHLAVPMRGDHAWRAVVEWSRADDWTSRPVLDAPEALFVIGRDYERRAVGLGWSFDDTDDPLLPRRGRRAEAGIERVEVTYRPLDTIAPPFTPQPVLDGREIGSSLNRVHASGRLVLPLGLRQALSFHGRAAIGRGDAEWVRLHGIESDDLLSLELSAGLGHTLRLWQSAADDPRPADLWIESGVEAGWEQAGPSGPLPNNPILRLAADVGLVYRNTWGLFRFVLGYRDLPEVD